MMDVDTKTWCACIRRLARLDVSSRFAIAFWRLNRGGFTSLILFLGERMSLSPNLPRNPQLSKPAFVRPLSRPEVLERPCSAVVTVISAKMRPLRLVPVLSKLAVQFYQSV